MRNIIGTPARGADFFPRPREVRKIQRSIRNGANIQLAAPRRVGKTSVLMYLFDNPMDGFEFAYIDTEAIDNAHDFFRKIFKEIIKCNCIGNSRKVTLQIKETANGFLRNIKSLNAGGAEIELKDRGDFDYFNELNNLIKGIDLEKKIVVMIDEFPYTISNIIEREDGGVHEAISFLQFNRSLRQDPAINGKIQFIYTGSIGLNTTVEQIESTALINDIESITVKPLIMDEATELVQNILDSEQLEMTPENTNYLLKKVEWLTPFYIKLILKEAIDLIDEETEITSVLIDSAFTEIIDYRNNNYFEHYYSRLRSFFEDMDFKFVVELLSQTAENGSINKNEIFELAVKHGVEDSYRKLRSTIIYDGYIHTMDNGENYLYNSPILRAWWKKHVCK